MYVKHILQYIIIGKQDLGNPLRCRQINHTCWRLKQPYSQCSL